ncbi:MAG TPA: hypothetical protein VHB50_07480 [Bryobacteraceae bacterium]|nr:hypothetical protein [Bryobacteraceae bacterium]
MKPSLRRSKMVSFRLSPEEFAKFQEICASQGVRSLSDFARTAMQQLIASNNLSDPLWHEVGQLREQIRALCVQVDRIAQVLEARQAKDGDL